MNRPFVLMYRTLDTEDAVLSQNLNYHVIILRYCLILMILLIEKLVNFIIIITCYCYASTEKLSLYL